MNDPNKNVRDWTEKDERKYREMLATPAKRPTEQEQFELGAVSPYPPLGAGNVSRKMNKNENTLTKNEKTIKEKQTTTNQDVDLNKLADKLAEKQKEDREIIERLKQATETPLFGQGNDNFAQAITEAGIKAAKATHEFNMKEIKARLIADLCKELVKTPMRYTAVPQRAREIAENALKEI